MIYIETNANLKKHIGYDCHLQTLYGDVECVSTLVLENYF